MTSIVKSLLITMTNFVLKVLPKVVNFLAPHKFLSCAFSSSGKLDLEVIRNELKKFEGGAVDLEMDDHTGIAIMTLNNPKKLNSLTGTSTEDDCRGFLCGQYRYIIVDSDSFLSYQCVLLQGSKYVFSHMMVEMADCITQLESWSKGKGLILMGVGGNFCSGGDLTFVRNALHYGAEMAAFQHDTLTRLLNLPLISVALLQGHTLGGGAELSTACDFRVMSSQAKVGFVQIKMGLITGWGATTRLVHMFGRQKALGLLSSGKVLTAEEAQVIGLVDHLLSYSLTSDDELGECKNWLTSNYCMHDAELIQALKHLVVYSDKNRDTKTSLNFERDVFSKYWGGPAHKAALSSKIKHK